LTLPTHWIQLGAGVAFIGFALWTIRGDSLNEDEVKQGRFGPFFTVALAFFIAELGDKTMLTTVTLASQYQAFLPVWIGSTIGMTIADGFAIVVGIVAGKRLPQRTIKLVSAGIFLIFGVWAIATALASWA
jgi:putative Ca2+/H+ antiporter (TMEM165/GDT1 family)